MERAACCTKPKPGLPDDLPLEMRLEFGQDLPQTFGLAHPPHAPHEPAHPDDLNSTASSPRRNRRHAARLQGGKAANSAPPNCSASAPDTAHKLAQYGLKLEGREMRLGK